MKHFANYIHLAPSFRTSSVTGNNVIMKSGFSEDKFITYNDVNPTMEQSLKSAGILYDFKLKVFVDKLAETQKNIYANNAPVILTILESETGEKTIIGTPDAPASISFIPGENHDQLVFDYSSKTAVL